jgi:hypothetical protein
VWEILVQIKLIYTLQVLSYLGFDHTAQLFSRRVAAW